MADAQHLWQESDFLDSCRTKVENEISTFIGSKTHIIEAKKKEYQRWCFSKKIFLSNLIFRPFDGFESDENRSRSSSYWSIDGNYYRENQIIRIPDFPDMQS